MARTSHLPSHVSLRRYSDSGKKFGRLGPHTQDWGHMSGKYSVTLAPMAEEDYALLAQWASADTWVYASGIQRHVSVAELKALRARADDTLLMVCTADGQAIGIVSWKPTGTPGRYVVGTMIGDPEIWDAGFGLEATILLVGMLFDSKNAHRVEFTCGVFNRRIVEIICSGLVTIEGILRDYYFVDGAYHDALIGSILKDEYYAQREPSEIVPAKDKEAAQRIVADFLEKNPIVPRNSPAG
jgi:diamine N-acetyltransferase